MSMRGYSVSPILVRQKASKEQGVYASLVAIAMRANNIAAEIKEHISAKLAPFMELAGDSENEEESIDYDQLEVSREFDQIPKPTILAMKEFLEGELKFRIEEKEEVRPVRRRVRRYGKYRRRDRRR